MEPVTYKPVVGFIGYRVGSDGSVWSNRFGGRWKPLRAHPDKDGYLRVNLKAGQPWTRSKLVHRYAHRLALEAFVGPCPEGMECCHGDGNPENNRIDNLRWDTPPANYGDRHRHGTSPVAHRNGRSRLDWQKAEQIRALLSQGISQDRIAERFGVGQTTVHYVKVGRHWGSRSRKMLALGEDG